MYATTTGNTQALAQAAEEAAKAAGREVSISEAAAADGDATVAADLIMLGSPAMGSEQLEDSMEEFFSGIEGKISGKKLVLFGSYDWGDGQFLRDWADRVTSAGATLAGCVQAHLAPEDADLDAIKKLAAV